MIVHTPCKEYPKVYGVKCASVDGLAHITLFTSLEDAIAESNDLFIQYHIHNEIIVFPLCGGILNIKDDEIQK